VSCRPDLPPGTAVLVSECPGKPPDFVVITGLGTDRALKPAGSATTPEAEAYKDSRDAARFPGAAIPLTREADDRVVMTSLDRLVQSMLGWRVHPAPACDLVLPPRSEPEGWWVKSGIIQPRPSPVVSISGLDSIMGWCVYEYVGAYDPFALGRKP
jgi:hypothetical protein